MAEDDGFGSDLAAPVPALDGRGWHRRSRLTVAAATGLLAATILAVPFRSASALITGGEGNKPIADPGWPKGAAVIFNHPARVAWWEGPPFGGGQWHAECRGDVKSLNAILTGLARMDGKNKRVFV